VKDAAGLQRVTHEVWRMKKLDLAKLHLQESDLLDLNSQRGFSSQISNV
jgi:hypothetical protein